MKFGAKAISPRFISSNIEESEYFQLALSHFIKTSEDIDIEVGKVKTFGESARYKIKADENLSEKEEYLTSLIGYGDAYWVKGCIAWAKLSSRILATPFDFIARKRMKRKIRNYADADVPKPNYSRPDHFSEYDKTELRGKVDGPAVLHLDWYEYLLENLEIDHDMNFDQARNQTIQFFLDDSDIDQEYRRLQIALSRHDEEWIERFEEKFNYRTFWLNIAEKHMEELEEKLSNN